VSRSWSMFVVRSLGVVRDRIRLGWRGILRLVLALAVVAASVVVVWVARWEASAAVDIPAGVLVDSVDSFGQTEGSYSVGDDGTARYVCRYGRRRVGGR